MGSQVKSVGFRCRYIWRVDHNTLLRYYFVHGCSILFSRFCDGFDLIGAPSFRNPDASSGLLVSATVLLTVRKGALP